MDEIQALVTQFIWVWQKVRLKLFETFLIFPTIRIAIQWNGPIFQITNSHTTTRKFFLLDVEGRYDPWSLEKKDLQDQKEKISEALIGFS